MLMFKCMFNFSEFHNSCKGILLPTTLIGIRTFALSCELATRYRFKNGIAWRPVALDPYATTSYSAITVTSTTTSYSATPPTPRPLLLRDPSYSTITVTSATTSASAIPLWKSLPESRPATTIPPWISLAESPPAHTSRP